MTDSDQWGEALDRLELGDTWTLPVAERLKARLLLAIARILVSILCRLERIERRDRT